VGCEPGQIPAAILSQADLLISNEMSEAEMVASLKACLTNR